MKLQVFKNNNQILKFLKLRFKFLTNLINKVFKKFNLLIIWRSGKAIGDQLLMAGFAKSLNKKNKTKIIILTNYPELLSLSPWIYKTISINKLPLWKIFYYLLKICEGDRIIEYNFPYRNYGFNSHLEAYQSGFYEQINNPPIWLSHVVDRFDKKLFKNFSGGLVKTKDEYPKLLIKKLRAKYNNYKIGIINPVGKGTYTTVKMYGFENYQKILDNTKSNIKWIQVGKKDDPKLKSLTLDLRGNTLSFLVDIVALSDLVLSDEGLLNHIAASFPYVNSYVTYSEFSPLNYYSYKNTFTIGKPEDISKDINYWLESSTKKKHPSNPIKLAKEILNNELKTNSIN